MKYKIGDKFEGIVDGVDIQVTIISTMFGYSVKVFETYREFTYIDSCSERFLNNLRLCHTVIPKLTKLPNWF
jgi:hypothetical protein